MMIRFLMLALVLLLPATIHAQRPQRREFIEDLLKSLIESQVDPSDPRNERPNTGRPPLVPRPGELRPGTTGSGALRPGMPVSPEMLDARRTLASFNTEMNRLVQGLNADQRQLPQLRAYLGDAVRLQANSNVLLQRANQYGDPQYLVDDFRTIDQQWRVLSHRLREVPGLSSRCSDSIGLLQTFDNQLCSALKIDPQINRHELVRLTTQLNSEFQHLLQDIYYSQQSSNHQVDQETAALYREGQKVSSLVNQATALIDRGSYDSIVSAYKRCLTDWRGYAVKLRRLDNPRIQGDVRKIEEIGRAINEHLWIPNQLDMGYVIHLTGVLESETTVLFESISVMDLLQCENPNQVLNLVREVMRQCGAFSTSLNASVGKAIDLDDLNWSFRVFELRWKDLAGLCSDIQRPEIRRQLDSIHHSMDALGQMIGSRPLIDHQALLQIAASLDHLSFEMEKEIETTVLRSSSYDPTLKSQMRKAVAAFHHGIHEFHEDIVSVRKQDHAVEHLPEIFGNWNSIKQLVAQCSLDHRKAFGQHRRDIEPLIVKLQIVFSE